MSHGESPEALIGWLLEAGSLEVIDLTDLKEQDMDVDGAEGESPGTVKCYT